MTQTFTAFQKRAIDEDGGDICVAAGAGSGKTGVLVERFVRLVAIGGESTARVPVDAILVITFTEKATKEMKSRIVAELTRRNLIAERRQVETAYISTIHGFCSRLLQENPFEAGVDPQFTVLDERQARRMLRQAFEDVIARAFETRNAEVTELVAATQAARAFGQDVGDPLAALAGAVESVLAKLRGVGRGRREVERHWRQGEEVTGDHSLGLVRSLLAPILAEISACAASAASLQVGLLGAVETAIRTLIEQGETIGHPRPTLWDTFVALKTIIEAVDKARPRASAAIEHEGEVFEIFRRVRLACEDARALFGVVAEREHETARLCHRLLGLTVAVWTAYDEAKRKRGSLDNDDLQSEGVRLLEEAPTVRERYRRRFEHILVDEFQDTNPLQMRLVDLLHAPEKISAPGRPSQENQLFVVGDVQQSIYAFRHANPDLFRGIERRFREQGAGLHVPLSVNFRSRPELLHIVEQVFRQVWREAPTPFVPLTPGAAFDPKPSPSLEVLLGHEAPRRDYVWLEADALAVRFKQIVERGELRITNQHDKRRGETIGYRDIALLLRSLTDVQRYEEAFARRGVPFFVVGGGRGYYARHEIRDLLNVLIVLDTPYNDVALAAALRSPMVGADVDSLYRIALQAGPQPEAAAESEDGRRRRGALYPAILQALEANLLPDEEAAKLSPFVAVIEDLRRQEDRLPVGHLLERLIARTRYDARLLCRPDGRRRLANVRKLLQMANTDSVLGVREFIRRLRDLEKLSNREGDAPTEEEAADVVRLLTIHSAKGLEFPVVAVADLSRGLIMPERALFVCDPHQMALGTRLGGEPSLVYKAIDQRREKHDREESARLLYVAMTRAREHLILSGNLGRNRGFNWADNLFPILGIQDVPPEPRSQILVGGVHARLARLDHYTQTPVAAGQSRSPAAEVLDADQLAADLLRQPAPPPP